MKAPKTTILGAFLVSMAPHIGKGGGVLVTGVYVPGGLRYVVRM